VTGGVEVTEDAMGSYELEADRLGKVIVPSAVTEANCVVTVSTAEEASCPRVSAVDVVDGREAAAGTRVVELDDSPGADAVLTIEEVELVVATGSSGSVALVVATGSSGSAEEDDVSVSEVVAGAASTTLLVEVVIGGMKSDDVVVGTSASLELWVTEGEKPPDPSDGVSLAAPRLAGSELEKVATGSEGAIGVTDDVVEGTAGAGGEVETSDGWALLFTPSLRGQR